LRNIREAKTFRPILYPIQKLGPEEHFEEHSVVMETKSSGQVPYQKGSEIGQRVEAVSLESSRRSWLLPGTKRQKTRRVRTFSVRDITFCHKQTN